MSESTEQYKIKYELVPKINQNGLLIEVDMATLSEMSEELVDLFTRLSTFEGKYLEIDKKLTEQQDILFKEITGDIPKINNIDVSFKPTRTINHVKIKLINSKNPSEKREHRLSDESSMINHINEPMNDLIKRKNVNKRVEEAIQNNKCVCIFTGIGGSGKTQLARFSLRELIANNNTSKNESLRKRFYAGDPSISQRFIIREFFLHGIPDLIQNLINFITEFKLYMKKDEDISSMTPKQLFSVIVRSYRLLVNKPFVFIFDNIDDVQLSTHIQGFITAHREFIKQNGLVFITSQIENIITTDNRIELITINNGMNIGECFELLKRTEEYDQLNSLLASRTTYNSNDLEYLTVSNITSIKDCIKQFRIQASPDLIDTLVDILDLIQEFSALPFGLKVAYLFMNDTQHGIRQYLQRLEDEKNTFVNDADHNDNLKLIVVTDPYFKEKKIVSQIVAIQLLLKRFPSEIISGYTVSHFDVLKIISLCDNKNIPDFFIETIYADHSATMSSIPQNHTNHVDRFIIQLKKLSLIAGQMSKSFSLTGRRRPNNQIRMISLHQITKTALQLLIGEDNIDDIINETWRTFKSCISNDYSEINKALSPKLLSEHFFPLLTTIRLLKKEIDFDINLIHSCIHMVYELNSSLEYYKKYNYIQESKYGSKKFDQWEKIDLLIYSKIAINAVNCCIEYEDEHVLQLLNYENEFFIFLRDNYVNSNKFSVSLKLEEKCFLLTNIIRYFLYKNSPNLLPRLFKTAHSINHSKASPKFQETIDQIKETVINGKNITQVCINYLLILEDYYSVQLAMKKKYYATISNFFSSDMDFLKTVTNYGLPNNLRIATQYIASGKFDEVKIYLNKYCSIEPTLDNCVYLAEVYFLLAIAEYNTNKYPLISYYIKKINDIFSRYSFIGWNNKCFYFFQAVFSLMVIKKSNVESSQSFLNKIIFEYRINYSPIIHAYLGYCKKLLGDFNGSIDEYNKYLSYLGTDQDIIEKHNMVTSKLDKYLTNEAKRELIFFHRSINLPLSSAESIYKNVSICYEEIHNYMDAFTTYKQSIILHLKSSDYLSTNDAILDAKKLGFLASKINTIAKDIPYGDILYNKNHKVWFLFALCLENQANYTSQESLKKELYLVAANKFNLIFEQGERDEGFLEKAAHCYFEAGEYPLTLETYFILYKDKKNYTIRNQLYEYVKSLVETINLHIKKTQWDSLNKLLSKLIDVNNPDGNDNLLLSNALLDAGVALFSANRKNEALLFFNKANEYYTLNILNYYLGKLYINSNELLSIKYIILFIENINNSERDFERDAKDMLVSVLLSISDNHNLDKHWVLEVYTKANKLIEFDIQTKINFGKIYLKCNEIECAISMLENACKALIPDNNDFSNILSEVHKISSKDKNARKCLNELIQAYFKKIDTIFTHLSEKTQEQLLFEMKLYLGKAKLIVYDNEHSNKVQRFEQKLVSIVGDLDAKINILLLLVNSWRPEPRDKENLSSLFFQKGMTLYHQHINLNDLTKEPNLSIFEEIKKIFIDATYHNSNNIHAWYMVAILEFYAKKYNEALTTLDKISEKNRKFIILKGHCYYRLGKSSYLNAYEAYTEGLLKVKDNNETDSDTNYLDTLGIINWIHLAYRDIKFNILGSTKNMEHEINKISYNYTQYSSSLKKVEPEDENSMLFFLYRDAMFNYVLGKFNLYFKTDLENTFNILNRAYTLFDKYLKKVEQKAEQSLGVLDNPLVKKANTAKDNILFKFLNYNPVTLKSHPEFKKTPLIKKEFASIPKKLTDEINSFELEKIRIIFYEEINKYINGTSGRYLSSMNFRTHGSAGIERAKNLLNSLKKINRNSDFLEEIDKIIQNKEGADRPHSLKTYLKNAIKRIEDNPKKFFRTDNGVQNLFFFNQKPNEPEDNPQPVSKTSAVLSNSADAK